MYVRVLRITGVFEFNLHPYPTCVSRCVKTSEKKNTHGGGVRKVWEKSEMSTFTLWLTVAEIKRFSVVCRRIIDSRAEITYCRSAMSIYAGWEANKLPRFYGNRAPGCGSLSRDLWSQLHRIIRYFYSPTIPRLRLQLRRISLCPLFEYPIIQREFLGWL